MSIGSLSAGNALLSSSRHTAACRGSWATYQSAATTSWDKGVMAPAPSKSYQESIQASGGPLSSIKEIGIENINADARIVLDVRDKV